MAYRDPLPYIPRYDELELLRAELDQEDRIREQLEYANGELEKSIDELEQYVRELDDNQKNIDDNEWKVRYESQVGLNKQLNEQKDWLETELAEARRKLTTGSYPEAMNFNLDALTEAELLRLVKHLERMRNDFYSTLRDTEWKLDKESKEFHQFDEMRRVYKSDLKHANAQIERLKFSVLDPSGIISPIYPPGYFRWLETHTPHPVRRSKSTSPIRKPKVTTSPTRTKSRNNSKGKKKQEIPPPSDEEEEERSTPEEEGVAHGSEEEEEDEGPSEPGPSTSTQSPSKSKMKQMDNAGGGSPSKGKRDGSKERKDHNE